jgi:hypothetical protein
MNKQEIAQNVKVAIDSVQATIDKAVFEKFEAFRIDFLLKNAHSAAGVALQQKRHIRELHFLSRYCATFPDHRQDKIFFALAIFRATAQKEEAIQNAVAFTGLSPGSAQFFREEAYKLFANQMQISFNE